MGLNVSRNKLFRMVSIIRRQVPVAAHPVQEYEATIETQMLERISGKPRWMKAQTIKMSDAYAKRLMDKLTYLPPPGYDLAKIQEYKPVEIDPCFKRFNTDISVRIEPHYNAILKGV
ncbi:hypothetical protein AVT69_gp249 [Pseudomonas phage PhiPA3]|uniref:Uncharacterized protein 251 n=1 Tax=Pseudomonas phage PhiPA3 TaxID=998086 RepID=F8SJ92_BPPA3|nr:hypothetical protein AVT69_gp249 [Pseudomonas phage PhiPA3]AEH03674.1 hypothetical protein [Pseudomonas phage PhiPA3]